MGADLVLEDLVLGAPAAPRIQRWYYADSWQNFQSACPEQILGAMAQQAGGPIELEQNNAWQQQIKILQNLALPHTDVRNAKVYFEYTIPRLGRRVDVLLLVQHLLFVIEFKIGEKNYASAALDQVWDYALDLKNFHETSHAIGMVPILVATQAPPQTIHLTRTVHADGLLRPICANLHTLASALTTALEANPAAPIHVPQWEGGRYLPTPTLVEAARALYAGHSVQSISRHDAGSQNLAKTSQAIHHLIAQAKAQQRKILCFVTGVPGAGKTLVGLDVAHRHMNPRSAMHSVFLSGNGPLVDVLREALARDAVWSAQHVGHTIRKGDARKRVEAFIQNVHHFRDDCLRDPSPPLEHVVLFDEAQRAWTREQASAFMARKKGRLDFDQSEPEFLISCLDRHPDWAVMVCLVGGGQEINTGEAGIGAWLQAVLDHFENWEVHLSPELTRLEYGSPAIVQKVLDRPQTVANPHLHLSTSMRSFRAASLSAFVQAVLELHTEQARQAFLAFQTRYPLCLTRDLERAKQWLREQARGTERYGIVVSSHAQRLKPLAIDVRVKTDPVRWFLDAKTDVRSSDYLEDVATEFQVQGLELDWACLVWDADLRYHPQQWSCHEFRGSRWQKINKPERQRYLKNAYRVLMTRARQGMVWVIPEGHVDDPTRDPDVYDQTFEYLRQLGIPVI